MEDKKVLKEALKSRGMTQTALAKELGMLVSGLSMNMSRDNMGLDNFRKILNALDYDVVVVDRRTGEKVWTVDS
mgnify:CR=1 FL=1